VNGGSKDDLSANSDWTRWVERHASALLLFARQQAGCEADAQDLVQEAVVESWRKQANGTPPQVGLVYATIRHRAIDLARRAGREMVASQETAQCWFDSGLDEREGHLLLQKAMNQLPPIYRDVVTLKVWGELTFSEIAQALEIPANTAASRYRYGLIELRKLTKEDFA
jgi:RNA polymerase sigma factor (sigma-70 family)